MADRHGHSQSCQHRRKYVGGPKGKGDGVGGGERWSVGHGVIERLLEVKVRQVADALMSELHDSEKVKAAAFLKKAEEAFENQWKRIITGMGQGGAAPEIDTTFKGKDESDEGGPTQ